MYTVFIDLSVYLPSIIYCVSHIIYMVMSNWINIFKLYEYLFSHMNLQSFMNNFSIILISLARIIVKVKCAWWLELYKELAWYSEFSVSPTLNPKKLRNMILMARENGLGRPNKNCWILFYRCPRLKICFRHVRAPGGKNGITACCQISEILG